MSKRWAAWPRGLRWLIGGIAAAVLTVATAWVLFIPVADWIATHDVGSVIGPLRAVRLQTARDAARDRLLTLGAGVLAAGALIFTASNYRLAQRTHELTEQGQVTDRYTKAIEQLGSDKLDVRIGGIYALERIARDSPQDHPTVMEVLATFVREHSREQRPPVESGPELPQRATRPDVQAAVTVIGRRNPQHDQQEVYLEGADLTGANLTGANLTGTFIANAKLTRANLGSAELSDANLATADLTEAFLPEANLSGAYLADADLTRAALTGVDLTGANLAEANLTGAFLMGATLTGADLSGAKLTDADFTRARWPSDAVLPEGWERDADSGRLKRIDIDSDESASE